MNLSFVVEGKPQGKQRPRFGKNGLVYTPKETKSYERSVAWAAKRARPKGWDTSQAVKVTVACFFPDSRRRDGDNVLKAVLDAMNHIIYDDDCQVLIATVGKSVCRDDPHIIVLVEQYTSIFIGGSVADEKRPRAV